MYSLGNCLKKNNIIQTINSSNQVTQNNASTFTYDLNGNLTGQSNPAISYTYDALDRLIAIAKEGSRTTFQYDALNRCLEITNSQGTKKLLYQGNQEIGSQFNGKIDEFRLIHPEQEITFSIEIKEEQYFPIQDHRGNICALQKADGSIPQWIHYSAFGKKTVEGASLENPWLFNNRREVCGLTLFTHRFYNPALMRWQTPDPLGFEDGLNLYTYVRNNPHYYKDPDGRFVFVIPIFIGVFGPSGIVITGATVGAIAGTVAGTALAVVTYKAIQAADHKYDQVEADSEENKEKKKRPPYCGGEVGNDPTKSPGEGFQWKGKGGPETGRGNWVKDYRKPSQISLHPDINHPPPKAPHWDYEGPDYPNGAELYLDGTWKPKA